MTLILLLPGVGPPSFQSQAESHGSFYSEALGLVAQATMAQGVGLGFGEANGAVPIGFRVATFKNMRRGSTRRMR